MEHGGGRPTQAAAGGRSHAAARSIASRRGGLLHFGQGKWYPGEPLPRWALRCYWRKDGEPIWRDESLLADPIGAGDRTRPTMRGDSRKRWRSGWASNPDLSIDGFEDVLYYTWKERRLPANVDSATPSSKAKKSGRGWRALFEQGITAPVGCVLPLRKRWWDAEPQWESGPWVVRSDEMYLIPGDSAMGFRLPLAIASVAKAIAKAGTFGLRDRSAATAARPLITKARGDSRAALGAAAAARCTSGNRRPWAAAGPAVASETAAASRRRQWLVARAVRARA